MRYSRQRERIYRTVLESADHPTAYMVYEWLRAEMPSLSLGTVYRNLNQLCDSGQLKRLPMPDGHSRFDKLDEAHAHIICEGCGRVADVMLRPLDMLKSAVSQETAYTLHTCDIVMHGLCEDCQQTQSRDLKK